LTVTGSTSIDNQAKVTEFNLKAKTILANLVPNTVQIEIKSQVGVGSQFKDMTEVVSVFKN
jgi:thiol-disulfide isomerase/thioredoxin